MKIENWGILKSYSIPDESKGQGFQTTIEQEQLP